MTDWILILGATSDLAQALARQYAARGHNLYLAGRNETALAAQAAELRQQFAIAVEARTVDVLEMESHIAFYQQCDPKPAGVILCIGTLGDQALGERDWTEARRILESNFTGCVSLLNPIAQDFEMRKAGFLVVVTSVAGDRGRRSNYLYGSAKAGLTAYLSGLRNRLHAANVAVLTVKPGFMNTRMTRGLKLPPRLTAQPEAAARAIFRAQQRKQDVLYVLGVWRWVMAIIGALPETVFKRLSL